jgi:hypothetical protein
MALHLRRGCFLFVPWDTQDRSEWTATIGIWTSMEHALAASDRGRSNVRRGQYNATDGRGMLEVDRSMELRVNFSMGMITLTWALFPTGFSQVRLDTVRPTKADGENCYNLCELRVAT